MLECNEEQSYQIWSGLAFSKLRHVQRLKHTRIFMQPAGQCVWPWGMHSFKHHFTLFAWLLSLWLTYTLLLNPQMFLGYRRLICRKNRDIIKLQQTKWPQLPHRGHGSSTDKTVGFFFTSNVPSAPTGTRIKSLCFPYQVCSFFLCPPHIIAAVQDGVD